MKEFVMTRYKIFGKTVLGEVLELFTWVRDIQSGIRRAEREAKEFGIELVDIWVEKVN